MRMFFILKFISIAYFLVFFLLFAAFVPEVPIFIRILEFYQYVQFFYGRMLV